MNKTTLHCPRALLPDGWASDCRIVVDERGFIESITTGQSDPDCTGLSGTVLPGMVNTHSHVHQRLIAGLTGARGDGSDSFWTWRERMYQAVGMLDGDDLAVLARRSWAELLEGGYTTTGEFHYPHRIAGDPADTARLLVGSAEQAGMNLTLLPVWYRYSGFGRQAPTAEQQPFVLTQSELAALVESIRDGLDSNRHRVGVAPHSLRAVDVDDLPGLTDAVATGPIHLHISEQPGEVDQCRRHTGRTPIELLAERIELDRRWCLIHATHATVAEIHALSGTPAVVCVCPTTEADLGDGLFPARAFADLGGRLAIGSDSNLVVSAAEELRMLEWGQRLIRHERNVFGQPGSHVGAGLWQSMADGGAAALDQPAGRLVEGQRADLVVLDDSHPMLAGLDPDACLDTFLMATAPGMIDQVYSAGKKIVEGGVHIQRESLDAEFSHLRQRLVGAS